MEWAQRMNNVIDYIEAHLTGEIDCGEISRIMACPYTVFQRAFGPVTGMQLSEYIRRRRMTCAAYELQTTSQRVLDIAVKYGYDSADAFAAAFRRIHGLTPREARNPDAPLKFYSRLTFTIMITGVQEMEYKILRKAAFTVLGVRRITPHGGGTWGIMKTDGSKERLEKLVEHSCDLGLCFGFDEQGNNDYMCGVEYSGNQKEDWDSCLVPASQWLVFTAKGTISGDVLGETWKRIYGGFLPQSQYQQRALPTIEQYIQWDEAADTCHVDIWIPIADCIV